jgi:hypothetical protein
MNCDSVKAWKDVAVARSNVLVLQWNSCVEADED